MATVTLTASADYGHTGQYVARLTGRNSKFTFEREFLGSKVGKRGEYTKATVDDPGLYELRDVTRKGKVERYRLVLARGEDLVTVHTDKADAMGIAKALDAGRAFADVVRLDGSDSYEILSAKAAERAAVAQTVDSAIAACWAAIEALPPKESRKVLAALRTRLNPPKESEPLETTETTGAQDPEVTS